MRLHENKALFQDTILAAERPVEEGGLGIKSLFMEKDYWIARARIYPDPFFRRGQA